MILYSRTGLLTVPLIALTGLHSMAAYAQGGENIRGEREARAPQVMTPAAGTGAASDGAYSLDEAMERQVWQEAQKRLATVEASDPKRALAEYKKFWQGRVPHPGVAIEVALKVVELRLKLNDVAGALLTCEYMQQKYAAEPTAVQLSLEKARVLVRQQRFEEAAATVDGAMPKLLALGPSSYPHTSEVLLNLAQASGETGGEAGKQWASQLYEGVEQVYLRWTKQDAIDHLWQRFEALQIAYQQVGDSKKAEELLPKVSDTILKTPVKKNYVEGAVLSLETARWLMQQGQEEQAALFYARVPQFGDEHHTILARYDQVAIEMQKGNSAQARKILLQPAPNVSPSIRLATSSAVANSYYQEGDFAEAGKLFLQIVTQAKTIRGSNEDRDEAAVIMDAAKEHLRLIEKWMQTPLVCEPSQFFVRPALLGDEPVTRWLYVSSSRYVPVEVKSSNPFVVVKEGQKRWADDGQLQYNQEFEVTVSNEAQSSTASWLTVTSPRFPTAKVQVPVQFTTIEGGEQIENSPQKTP